MSDHAASSQDPVSAPDTSNFHKQKHIKYWLRCLKTYLPTPYTSNDAVRMTLAFFVLSALDLLDALHGHTTAAERSQYADWILRCEHPGGGFRGFTGTMVAEEPCHDWDAANLAATYFACAALVILGEGIDKVRRKECLAWVKRLQKADGSFGEALGKGGSIEGEWPGDVRFCYLAAGVRWMLRRGAMEEVEDFDVEGLVRFVESSVTFEGGIGQAPLHEAHAGLTYSGVGALSLLGRLPSKAGSSTEKRMMSSKFVEDVTRWLVQRQTLTLRDDEDLILDDEDTQDAAPTFFPPKFHVQGSFAVPAVEAVHIADPLLKPSQQELKWVGVNGRCNKVADTCYSFWVGGSLGILNKVYLQDFNGIRRYLLEKTQHMIGGFGKMPGDPPDILHSFLGLANLAIMREPDLKSLDPTLCISIGAREDFEQQNEIENADRDGHTSHEAGDAR